MWGLTDEEYKARELFRWASGPAYIASLIFILALF